MKGEGVFMPIYPKWALDYFSYDIRKDAPHCECPAFIISAGDDLTVAREHEHEKLTELFPQAAHVIIPKATHTFVKHEAELTDTITQWLTSS